MGMGGIQKLDSNSTSRISPLLVKMEPTIPVQCTRPQYIPQDQQLHTLVEHPVSQLLVHCWGGGRAGYFHIQMAWCDIHIRTAKTAPLNYVKNILL